PPHLFVAVHSRPADHGALHSLPTRRSSDLPVAGEHLSQYLCADQRKLRLVARIGRGRLAAGGGCAALPPEGRLEVGLADDFEQPDRKSTRLNSSHVKISYAVFCLKKKNTRT